MRHGSFKSRIRDPNPVPTLASALPGTPTVESVRIWSRCAGRPGCNSREGSRGILHQGPGGACPAPAFCEAERGGATRMCTAGAPRPPRTAGTWARDLRAQLGAGGGRARRGLRCGPRVPASVRAVYHGRALRAPLPAGAPAMLRLGGYGGGRLQARGRLSEPLPVLPYHGALHASVAGGRACGGAADLHPVSAARGCWGPRDV